MEKKNEGPLLLVLLALALVGLLSNTFYVSAVVGIPNATVTTTLQVGNTFPEILNVSIDEDIAAIDLNANSTRTVSCVVIIRDFNGENDVSNVNATFYDNSVANPLSPDDNNDHYSNASCVLNDTFGSFNGYNDTAFTTLANCTFQVQYYANPSDWTCNVTVNDTTRLTDQDFDNVTMSQLLSLALPNTIDYGTVNATEVSRENRTEMFNSGNIKVNLTLSGYAVTVGDGNAMNCTLGSLQNISIEHEKFNLTSSNTSVLTLGQAEQAYTNMSVSTVVYDFNLTARTNDTVDNSNKSTHWRMYVPNGVAGNCSGNLVFGATVADGV